MLRRTLHEIGEPNLKELLDRANEMGIKKEDIVQIIVTPKGGYKLVYESM